VGLHDLQSEECDAALERLGVWLLLIIERTARVVAK
jgi:hypothetical protein